MKDLNKVIEDIEHKISSYESYVEIMVRDFDKKQYSSESMDILCSLHHDRGVLDGLEIALDIIKSGMET